MAHPHIDVGGEINKQARFEREFAVFRSLLKKYFY